jgi:D-aminopeptidase
VRVAIIFDMEGVSQIEDLVELYPIYEEYWRIGRQKLTNDVLSAALGLMDEGVSEIAILNHHGAGEAEFPNLMTEVLPPGVTQADDWGKRALREHVDAVFQVGCHAWGGSPTFHSHTICPGLRLRLNGELLSESHWWALTGAAPVLGIVGSEALGANRGFLSEVPFLAVQTSPDRLTPRPLFADPEEGSAAIRAFARSAVRNARRQRAFAPRDFVLDASVQNGDDAAPALAAGGWTRTSRTEFKIEAAEWRADGDPIDEAIWTAVAAAWVPYSAMFKGLDPSTESTGLAYPADAFANTDAMLRSWSADRTVEWITPERASRWEGMEIGQA